MKAVEQFERMRRRAAERACPFLFSAAEANAVCTFVEQLPHVEGRWTTDTVRLEAWQIFILVACFGFRRRVDGRRLVTTVFFAWRARAPRARSWRPWRSIT